MPFRLWDRIRDWVILFVLLVGAGMGIGTVVSPSVQADVIDFDMGEESASDDSEPTDALKQQISDSLDDCSATT